MIKLDHYGLFETEAGLRFLFQGNGVSHLLGDDVDFEVSISGRKDCPHQINLSLYSNIDLPGHPLIREFLPLPAKGGERTPLYLPETVPVFDLIGSLLRLSSPTPSRRNYFIWDRGYKATQPLQATNLQPPIIMGYGQGQSSQITRLAALLPHLPRRAIILGPEWLVRTKPTYVPYSEPLAEKLEDLPLEAIGARIVRDYLFAAS